MYLSFKIGESCSVFINLVAFDPNFAYLKAVAALFLLLIPCKEDQNLMEKVPFLLSSEKEELL